MSALAALQSDAAFDTIGERSDMINSNSQTTAGEMAEWFKAHAWKACVL